MQNDTTQKGAAMIQWVMFRSLWDFRGFILGAVKREFLSRYQGSVLGAVWAILNPLTMIVIYSLIFSQLMHARLPGKENHVFAYSIYLCSGVLTWTLFAEMLGRMSSVFLENGNLIKKANFPRACLPLIVVLSALLNFFIIMVLFLIFLAITCSMPGYALLAFPLVLAIQLVFTVGLGIVLGTLNVFFRDVGHLTSVVLQIWFWLTPIVYVVGILPENIKSWLAINPMWPLIRAYQTIFVENQFPEWISLLPILVLSLVLLWLAARLFMARAGEIVDEL
jgi:lipopolysaccharide transport system permease protein